MLPSLWRPAKDPHRAAAPGGRRPAPRAPEPDSLRRATLTPERLEAIHRVAAEHAWRHVLTESPPGMDLAGGPVFHLTRHDVVHRVVVRPEASGVQELVHHHDLHHSTRRPGAVTSRRQR